MWVVVVVVLVLVVVTGGKQSQLLLQPTKGELGLQVGVELDNIKLDATSGHSFLLYNPNSS